MAMHERTSEAAYNIHWSAILAGAFTSVGVWMFLYALGAAIGGSGGKNGPDTWTAVYTVVAPIIAFFFGGMMISRARGIETKGDGAVHGVVAWGFATVIGSLLLATMGAEVLVHSSGRVNIPSGYFWAVAGSILGSLITSVLGSMLVKEHEHERERVGAGREVPVGTTRREVYP